MWHLQFQRVKGLFKLSYLNFEKRKENLMNTYVELLVKGPEKTIKEIVEKHRAIIIEEKMVNSFYPHLTLAYIQPEAIDLYLEEFPPFTDTSFDANVVEWSGSDGYREMIPLSFLPVLGEKGWFTRSKKPSANLEGQPCTTGHTESRDGCIPASGGSGGKRTSGQESEGGQQPGGPPQPPKYPKPPSIESMRGTSHHDVDEPEHVRKAREEYKAKGTGAAAFKAWFGDWENDPANASKVVKRNGEPAETKPGTLEEGENAKGEPVLVFHGTPYGSFDEFNAEMQSNPEGLYYGPGFYFTEDYQYAEDIAKGSHNDSKLVGKADRPHVIHAYLNIRKPFDGDNDKFKLKELPEHVYKTLRQKAVQEAFSQYGAQEARQAGLDFDAGADGMSYSYSELTSGKFGVGGLGAISKKELNKHLQDMGYDGIAVTDALGKTRHWIVFKSEQAKSVENIGTFQGPKFDKSFEYPSKDAAGTCKQGERSDLTGCIPVSGSASPQQQASNQVDSPVPAEPSSPEAPPSNAPVESGDPTSKVVNSGQVSPAKAKLHRRVIGKMTAFLDKVPGGRWVRRKMEKIHKKLIDRYGPKVTAAVIATGQVISWGAFGVGIAVGVPIWIPSAVATAPAAALAELNYRIRGKASKDPEIVALAEDVVAELETGITDPQEREIKSYNPHDDPHREEAEEIAREFSNLLIDSEEEEVIGTQGEKQYKEHKDKKGNRFCTEDGVRTTCHGGGLETDQGAAAKVGATAENTEQKNRQTNDATQDSTKPQNPSTEDVNKKPGDQSKQKQQTPEDFENSLPKTEEEVKEEVEENDVSDHEFTPKEEVKEKGWQKDLVKYGMENPGALNTPYHVNLVSRFLSGIFKLGKSAIVNVAQFGIKTGFDAFFADEDFPDRYAQAMKYVNLLNESGKNGKVNKAFGAIIAGVFGEVGISVLKKIAAPKIARQRAEAEIEKLEGKLRNSTDDDEKAAIRKQIDSLKKKHKIKDKVKDPKQQRQDDFDELSTLERATHNRDPEAKEKAEESLRKHKEKLKEQYGVDVDSEEEIGRKEPGKPAKDTKVPEDSPAEEAKESTAADPTTIEAEGTPDYDALGTPDFDEEAPEGKTPAPAGKGPQTGSPAKQTGTPGDLRENPDLDAAFESAQTDEERQKQQDEKQRKQAEDSEAALDELFGKAMSWTDTNSGGALVKPPAFGLKLREARRKFSSRWRMKSMRYDSKAAPKNPPGSAKGQPCKRGQSAARTGCIPASKKPGTAPKASASTPAKKPPEKKPAAKPAALASKPPAKKSTPEETITRIDELRKGFTTEGLLELAQSLHGHTVAELKQIKEKLGLKASGDKAELAKKIAERALSTGKKLDEEQVEEVAKKNAEKAERAPDMENEQAVRAEANDLIRSQYEKSRFEIMTLPKLYESLKKQNPDLRLSQFHEMLREMNADGEIYLKPFTSSFATMKDPQSALFLDREVKYYVIPGDKKPQASAPAKPKVPVIKPKSDSPAFKQADTMHEQLSDLDDTKAESIRNSIDEAANDLSATDFQEWASRLIGTKVKGSKEKVRQEVKAFVDRLAVSAAQSKF
jgi:hypothetical protein